MEAARFFQGAAEGDDLDQDAGDAIADRGDHRHEVFAARSAIGFSVGGDHLLVDAPGGLDLDVVVTGRLKLQTGNRPATRGGLGSRPVCSIRHVPGTADRLHTGLDLLTPRQKTPAQALFARDDRARSREYLGHLPAGDAAPTRPRQSRARPRRRSGSQRA